MHRHLLALVFLGCSFTAVAGYGYAQSAEPVTEKAVEPSGGSPKPNADSGIVGLGVKTSLLGVGAEVAARVTHRTNLRAGYNILGYSRSFNKDGVNYDAHLGFRTIEAHYDIFPWARAFHVSPGLLAYIGNPISASAVQPGNKSFTLGGHTYYSDPANPATASAHINFNQVSPMVTVGWGNLVHRDSKRFTVSFEVGAAFQGSPKTTLSIGGNVCDSPGLNCRSAASDSNVQANIISEQGKINRSMAPFKVYPIISLGFGYKLH
jgi:hypothetical protein